MVYLYVCMYRRRRTITIPYSALSTIPEVAFFYWRG